MIEVILAVGGFVVLRWAIGHALGRNEGARGLKEANKELEAAVVGVGLMLNELRLAKELSAK